MIQMVKNEIKQHKDIVFSINQCIISDYLKKKTNRLLMDCLLSEKKPILLKNYLAYYLIKLNKMKMFVTYNSHTQIIM